MARQHVSLTIKLASALLQMRDSDNKLLIEWEHSKKMSAEQIISLFQFDHYPIRHEAGGPAEPWNLMPRLIMLHRVKTATVDAPQIAKIRHVTKAEEQFRARLLAKDRGETKPKSRWPQRSMRTKR